MTRGERKPCISTFFMGPPGYILPGISTHEWSAIQASLRLARRRRARRLRHPTASSLIVSPYGANKAAVYKTGRPFLAPPGRAEFLQCCNASSAYRAANLLSSGCLRGDFRRSVSLSMVLSARSNSRTTASGESGTQTRAALRVEIVAVDAGPSYSIAVSIAAALSATTIPIADAVFLTAR